MRRLLAAFAVSATLATTLALVAPKPAEAAVITNAKGCGTNLTVGLDAALLLIPGFSKTYNNVKFDCVLTLKQFDLGFAALPLGTVGAGGAKTNIRIENTTSFISGLTFEATTPGQGVVDGCIPIALGVAHYGTSPDRARFQCIALRTYLKDGQPDPTVTGFLPFQIVTLNWDLVEGSTVNGLGGLQVTGIGFIDNFILDLVIGLIGGGVDLSLLTDGPVIQTKS